MAKQLGKNEFELKGQSPTIFESLDLWSPELEEELSDLLRALRRKKGFSLFFVQCNPALGERIIEAIRERFPQKKLARFELDRESETLYRELIESYQTEQFKIACVTGIEQTLYAYEDTKRLAGWSSEDIYSYSWKGVPTLLSHLNYHRELFETNLPISFIFLVPRFAIDYFIQRAPDFFDWRSGFFKFAENSENLQTASYTLTDQYFKEYNKLTSEERVKKIIEIRDILKSGELETKEQAYLLYQQGRLFQIDKNFDRSLVCYEKALEIKSDDPDILNYHGHVLRILGRNKEAIKSYDRSLKIQPYNCTTWRERGVALQNSGNNKEALKSYFSAIEVNSNCSCAWQSRGDLLYNLDKKNEATESYKNAVKIQPNYHYKWNVQGNTLYKLKRYKEAIKSYDRAIEIQPDYHYSWYNRGNSLLNLKRYREAIKSYDRTLEIQADYYKAWLNRAFAFMNLKRYEEALKSYDHILEIQSDDYKVWLNRGNALQRLKRYEEALKSYDHILEIQSDYYKAWLHRGNALQRLKRNNEAAISLLKFLCYEPYSEKNWYFKFITWIYMKIIFSDFLFCIITKIKFNDSETWNQWGYFSLIQYSSGLQDIFDKPLLMLKYQDFSDPQNIAKIDLKCFQKSLNFFNTALKFNSQFTFAWVNRSFTAYHLQQYKVALQSCDNALEFDPKNKQKINKIVYSNRGYILLKLNNPTEALQDFTKALEIDSKLDEAWIGKGTALYQLDRYSEALDCFMQALELNHPLAQINIDRTKEKLSND